MYISYKFSLRRLAERSNRVIISQYQVLHEVPVLHSRNVFVRALESSRLTFPDLRQIGGTEAIVEATVDAVEGLVGVVVEATVGAVGAVGVVEAVGHLLGSGCGGGCGGGCGRCCRSCLRLLLERAYLSRHRGACPV